VRESREGQLTDKEDWQLEGSAGIAFIDRMSIMSHQTPHAATGKSAPVERRR